MNKQDISAIFAVTSLAFGTDLPASGMSKSKYKATDKGIEGEYKFAKQNCDSLAAHAKIICTGVVKSQEEIAKSQLKARRRPSKSVAHHIAIEEAESARLRIESDAVVLATTTASIVTHIDSLMALHLKV